MHTRKMALLTGMSVGLAATLVGCGNGSSADTNGIGGDSASQIQSKAKQAADKADAVHLSGQLISQKRAYKIDMQLQPNGGTGQVSTNGSTINILRLHKDLYIKASADFWSQGDKSGNSDAASKLNGKYVKVPPNDPAYKRLWGFTDKDVMLDEILTLHGDLSKGGDTDADGVRAVTIRGDNGDGGQLAVALNGKPYPLEMRRAGKSGVIRLEEWNEKFTLAAPSKGQIVDYGKRIPTGP